MSGFKNISISNKLIIIQVTTAFMAVLICCVIFVINDIKIFKTSQVRNKNSIAEIVAVNSVSPLLFNDQDAANKILLNLNSNPSILNAAILNKTGKEFARYSQKGEESFSFTKLDETALITPQFDGKEFLVSYKIFQEKEFLGTVILRAELTDLNNIISNYLKVAGLVLVAGLLAALVISMFLQRVITNRLLSLVSKTKEVTETGNYSGWILSEGKDEIAILSREFNNMLEQIEKTQNALKESNTDLEKRVQERTKELEQFVYVASHDLQEPLRTISNFVGLIEEEYAGKLDKGMDQYLRFIVTAARKMRNLIKDLLDFSRIGREITFAAVDCNEILNEVTAELGISIKESNTKITSSILPVLNGNEIELKQLFQNLISNAIKFLKKNVTPEIEITVEEKATEYLFAVRDNGIGIDEQYKDRIFIIFQRLHTVAEYPGTGIGLATCKKIVARHNGKIWIESKLGEGSTFYFTISNKL